MLRSARLAARDESGDGIARRRFHHGLLGCVLCVVTVVSACAEPPHKEMNQAQGAIEAARAAGAERYAAQELAAAVEALQQSEQAVTQRDYRLALSLAIDSRERAQSAAKVAVDTRAKARGDAERVVAEVNMLLTQARGRLETPAVARLSRRTLDRPSQTLATAQKNMQEARAALEKDDYQRAIQLANRVSASIQEALTAIDKATAVPGARKRR